MFVLFFCIVVALKTVWIKMGIQSVASLKKYLINILISPRLLNDLVQLRIEEFPLGKAHPLKGKPTSDAGALWWKRLKTKGLGPVVGPCWRRPPESATAIPHWSFV